MLYKQMIYFISVVDNNSFTKAADECFISQSAISQQIKALEEELGVKLLVRENRTFRLTIAGEHFYRESKDIVKNIEKLIKEVIDIDKHKEIVFNLGYIKTFDSIELHNAVVAFSSKFPEITLDITNGTHEELYELLINSKVDLIISDQRRKYNKDYNNFELIQSNSYIEISSNNKLSNKDSITIEDLKSMSCIVISSKDQQDNEKEFFNNTLGFKNKIIFVESLSEARLLVVSNRGFLLIEEIGKLNKVAQGITRIPLVKNGAQVQRNYCAFWSKENKDYFIEEFVNIMKELLNNN